MLPYFSFRSVLKEKYLFFLIIVINAVPILFTHFFPTMDGGAHLYNSNLLRIILSSNDDVINKFHSINSYPLPNWTGHFILAFLLYFFKPFFAEKILLLIYIVLLPLSFRYLVTSKKNNNQYISYLIFPFTYNFPFMCGFYNQSIAMILLILTTAYWYRNEQTMNPAKWLLIFLLISITYFSHFFIFIVLFVFLITVSLQTYIPVYFKSIDDRVKLLKKHILQLSFISLIFLIWFLVGMFFIADTDFKQPYNKYHLSELLNWIVTIRPIIIFGEGERIYTIPVFIVLLILTFNTVYSRFKPLKSKVNNVDTRNNFFRIPDLWFLLLLVFGLAFIFVPDSYSAGMMSLRLCLLFFIILLIWMSFQHYSKWVMIMLVLIVPLNMVSLFKKMPEFRSFDKEVRQIVFAANYIKPSSLVLPVTLTDHWYKGHFVNYLGAERNIILTDNYEASYGWFPVKWNMDKMPNIGLDNNENLENIYWIVNQNSLEKSKIDYIIVFGKDSSLLNSRFKNLSDLLQKSFRLIYYDCFKNVQLFEKIDSVAEQTTSDNNIPLENHDFAKFVSNEEYKNYITISYIGRRITYYKNKLMYDDTSMRYFKTKSNTTGISLDVLVDNAVDSLVQTEIQLLKQADRIDYYEKKIRESPDWQASVKKKAIEKNVPIDDMILEDAIYLLKNEYNGNKVE